IAGRTGPASHGRVRMVTIAIDASRAAAAQRTGTEAYSLHLIRALLALGAERRSARFTLYCRDTPPPHLFDLDAERAALSVIPAPRLWTHLRFAAALFCDRPDVT